jgi:Ca2+-transporting ATPase
MAVPTSTTGAPANWYSLSTDEIASRLDVDPASGLSAAEAKRRLEEHGPNRLTAKKAESALHAYLRQYRDFMQLILVGAAVVNQVVTGETGTTIVEKPSRSTPRNWCPATSS